MWNRKAGMFLLAMQASIVGFSQGLRHKPVGLPNPVFCRGFGVQGFRVPAAGAQ